MHHKDMCFLSFFLSFLCDRFGSTEERLSMTEDGGVKVWFCSTEERKKYYTILHCMLHPLQLLPEHVHSCLAAHPLQHRSARGRDRGRGRGRGR
jgi:hypothetical protein